MKVVDCRSTTVTVPLVEPERWRFGELWGLTSVVVEVETDGGLIGLGDVPGSPSIGLVREAIAELSGLLVDRDPRDVVGFLDRAAIAGSTHYATIHNMALGALEVALWDILGRSVGEPVWRLFGGLARPRIPFWWYVTPLERTEEQVREHAARGASLGFETIYLKIGFDDEADLRLARAIRDEVGPDLTLRIDVNEGWSRVDALRLLPAYGELGVDFVEEPIDASDLEGLAMLRARVPVAIGANQSAWRAEDAWRVISTGAADVVVSDHFQVGGLRNFRDLIAVCRASNTPLVRHAFGDLGICMAAGLQALGTMPGPHLAHQQYLQILEHQLITEPLRFVDGMLSVPTGSGLGVELDRDALAHYAELFTRFGEAAMYGDGPAVRFPASATTGRSPAID